VEASGIGERTAEGFGQVRFNDPLLTKPPGEWMADHFGPVGETAAAAEPDEPAVDWSTTGRTSEEAAWRDSLRAADLEATATATQREAVFSWQDPRKNRNAKPNMSQLGGLRAAVQFLRSANDQDRVLGWLNAVRETKKRRERWPAG